MDTKDWSGYAWNGSLIAPVFTWCWDDPATSANEDDLIPRGFTGHEMLDALGLIHMNGRIYDPRLGRFMSADQIVQAPQNLQSYNRYSYCFNNPLGLVDPSGYESEEEQRERERKDRARKERINREVLGPSGRDVVVGDSGGSSVGIARQNAAGAVASAGSDQASPASADAQVADAGATSSHGDATVDPVKSPNSSVGRRILFYSSTDRGDSKSMLSDYKGLYDEEYDVGGLPEMLDKLESLRERGVEISRIIILGHGSPGNQWIGGDILNMNSIRHTIAIASYIVDGGQLVFGGCRVGADNDDSGFLAQVSIGANEKRAGAIAIIANTTRGFLRLDGYAPWNYRRYFGRHGFEYETWDPGKPERL